MAETLSLPSALSNIPTTVGQYDTLVGAGQTYTTIKAAIDAGKTKLCVASSTTEAAQITLTADTLITILAGATVTCPTANADGLFTTAGTITLTINGSGTILFGARSAQVYFVTKSAGTIKTYISDITINAVAVNRNYVKFLGTALTVENCILQLSGTGFNDETVFTPDDYVKVTGCRIITGLVIKIGTTSGTAPYIEYTNNSAQPGVSCKLTIQRILGKIFVNYNVLDYLSFYKTDGDTGVDILEVKGNSITGNLLCNHSTALKNTVVDGNIVGGNMNLGGDYITTAVNTLTVTNNIATGALNVIATGAVYNVNVSNNSVGTASTIKGSSIKMLVMKGNKIAGNFTLNGAAADGVVISENILATLTDGSTKYNVAFSGTTANVILSGNILSALTGGTAGSILATGNISAGALPVNAALLVGSTGNV